MPNGLSFISRVAGTTQQGGATDPGMSMVEELMAQLEQPAPTPPPRVGAVRGTMGMLGDALTAMAAVRAGGAPPQIGQFAARTQRRQEQFELERKAFEEDQRNLRNRIRVRDFFDKKDREKPPVEQRQAIISDIKRRGFELSTEQEKEYLLTGRFSQPESVDELEDIERLARIGGRGVILGEDLDPRQITAAAVAAREESQKDNPNFAGFSTKASLESAIRLRANAIFDASKEPQEFKVEELGVEKTRVVFVPTITFNEALRRAIEQLPGANKFFPIPEKKKLSIEDIRKELRGRDAK